MSDNSRSRVTVTLGRSGRVVKRAGGELEGGFPDVVSVRGSKSSIRDRLGGSSDDRNQQYSKRQRGENFGASSFNDMHLGKDDLRLKLMQKSQVRNNDTRGNVDLRDKLSSRTSRPSLGSKTRPPHEVSVSTRQPVLEARHTGIRQHPVLEPRDTGTLGRIPSSRSASGFTVLDTGRTHSSWTLDNLRRRSPERLLYPPLPRGVSPERNREALLRRSLIRTYDDGRSSSSMRISPPRPVSSSLLTKSSVPPVRSVAPPPPNYHQASGFLQKISSTLDEHPTVESFLLSLGLDKYAIYFKAEEIDMNALRQLGDNDLKELGIPMGPRKKILQAVVSRSRRLP